MKRKPTLAVKIVLGLVLGILAGVCLTGRPDLATVYIKPFGTLFLNLVKMVVGPVVLFSIAQGVVSMKSLRRVSSVGGRTLLFFLCTTACAVAIGLVLATGCRGAFPLLSTAGLTYEAKAAPGLLNTFVSFFPSSAVAPLVGNDMLQIIVLALFLGAATLTAGARAGAAARFLEGGTQVATAAMSLVLGLSPLGVFALIAPVVAVNGPGILAGLAGLICVCYGAYLAHMLLVYGLSLRFLAKKPLAPFFKGMAPAMSMAFSSASSMGTLPMNLECARSLGADREISGFVLPLGATLNMDGTAIYQGVCTVFIAACFGVELTVWQMLTIVLTATLSSVGTAGVPGAGMIMLAMVLQSVGLPLEGIALVAGIDRLLDMGRTTVNITGDTVCALVLTRQEGKRRAAEHKARPV